MNISITGRHLELTEPIKAHINASVETLSRYNMDVISVNVVASTQTRKGNDHSVIEFVIQLAHKNSIVISQNDKDLYAAIDLATDRASKAMRRLHEQDKAHYKVGMNEAKAEIADVKETELNSEDEIVPVRLDLYKPQEVEDVLNELKQSNNIFSIFLDSDDKTRVLYKRDDGKFGLY